MSIGAYKQYSVLMAVYYKENASYLRQAIESIQNQTFPTNDFVLVCDGPLNLELDAVISEKQKEMGNTFHVIRLEKNCGLGNALNEGIRHCKNELIARMDSDDISYPDRCVRQMKVFELNPEIDICSGIIEEFSKSPDIIYARRVLPETSEEISKFAMKRNPFNHPCVMSVSYTHLDVYKRQIQGRINKEMKEICLLDQVYVKAEDGKQSVSQYVAEVAKANGAKIAVKKFVRFETGEGMEKKNEDFAAEVAKQMGQ